MNQRPTQILKVDVAGRVWTPCERRKVVPDESARSGMPAKKFAAHSGVKYPPLASWVPKRRKRGAAAQGAGAAGVGCGPAALRRVEAVRATGSGGERLSVHLPGGAQLEVADASQVALAAELLWAPAGPALAMREEARR